LERKIRLIQLDDRVLGDQFFVRSRGHPVVTRQSNCTLVFGPTIQKAFVLKGKIGGARRDRTADLVIANDALSQLSYGPAKRNDNAAVARNSRRLGAI
jgi:hypothetical protein